MPPILAYTIYFLVIVLVALLLNRILLKFAKTLGIRNHDVAIVRWSSKSKPALGGINFYIIFLLSFLVSVLVFGEEEVSLSSTHTGILLATTMAFLMGLSDDAYNTIPMLKFLVQVGCGVALIATGTCISLFPEDWMNWALTIVWVVAVMNSINMLDNMDSITTLVGVFVLLAALMAAAIQPEVSAFHITILVGVLGALIGFLYYNWHPSKMFMGDTGSQFLGIFLAAMGIVFFWNNKELDGVDEIPTKQILITLMAFIVPISDTATVIINRIRRGQSPFVGGKDHTTHHLVYLGCTERQVAMILAGICLVSFLFIGIILNFIDSWSHWYSGLFFTYFLVVLLTLFGCTQLPKAKAKFHEQQRPKQPQKAKN